jgi:hypothetical protein
VPKACTSPAVKLTLFYRSLEVPPHFSIYDRAVLKYKQFFFEKCLSVLAMWKLYLSGSTTNNNQIQNWSSR